MQLRSLIIETICFFDLKCSLERGIKWGTDLKLSLHTFISFRGLGIDDHRFLTWVYPTIWPVVIMVL